MSDHSLPMDDHIDSGDYVESNQPYDTIDPNRFNTMWIRNMQNKNHIFNMIRNDENTTNKSYTYKNVDGYHIFNHIPPERIKPGKEDWEVEYAYNNELFRSDHFTKEHDGLHILFGGCSNTEGVGSNIEDNWSYTLYQEISKQHKTSGYFSVAKGGYGWHQIFLNFKVYVEKYGAPDYYFVLHPNMVRLYTWQEDAKQWKYVQRNEGDDTEKALDLEYRNKFPDWVTAMSLFIAYCESVGTKFLWTTWATEQNKTIRDSKFFESTFFETKKIDKLWMTQARPDGNIAKDDVNFRDGHAGRLYHELWHHDFKNELIKKGWIFT